MNAEKELFIPHGVESVAVNGLRPEMAAIQRHPQHIDFDARTARAIARADILSRHNLKPRSTQRNQLVESFFHCHDFELNIV